MSEFSIVVQDGSGNEIAIPDGVTIIPKRYSEMDIGGCDVADMEAFGPHEALKSLRAWLGHRVFILNRNSSDVWWGRFDEILVARGPKQDGVSLRNMRNKVRVAYTHDFLGDTFRGTTDWAVDQESIDKYGVQEETLMLSDTTLTLAEAKRNAYLTLYSKPLIVQTDSAGDKIFSTLRASGWWHTTKNRYYQQLSGLEQNDVSGNADQVLGLGFTTVDYLGFAKAGKISDLDGQFEFFPTDIGIQISGSSSNNGAFTAKEADGKPAQSYTAITIRFDFDDDVWDDVAAGAGGGFGFIETDDYITIAGSIHSSNNGLKRVREAGADHLIIDPKTIATDVAGASITIARGNSIVLGSTLVNEVVASGVTVTAHGERIAQSFTPTVNLLAWTVNRVRIRLRKVGAPADDVQVELCANSSGAPGTVLDTATIAASLIPKDFGWVTFQLSNLDALTFGTIYHLVLSRTGANDWNDFYEVELDEDLSYAGGSLQLYTGAAWTTRTPDADLVFQVLGAWETTIQIQQIIFDVGDFFAGGDNLNVSGIFSNQYRAGDRRAQDELLDLLNAGTTAGRRLLAKVTKERILRIYEQPASTAEPQIMQADDGTLQHISGQPLEHGRLCAGQWVERTDVSLHSGSLLRQSPFFVTRAEYDCERNTVRLEIEGTPSVWDVGKITEASQLANELWPYFAARIEAALRANR